jgi:hypothetical protein
LPKISRDGDHAFWIVGRQLALYDDVDRKVHLRVHRLAVFADDLVGQRAALPLTLPFGMALHRDPHGLVFAQFLLPSFLCHGTPR